MTDDIEDNENQTKQDAFNRVFRMHLGISRTRPSVEFLEELKRQLLDTIDQHIDPMLRGFFPEPKTVQEGQRCPVRGCDLANGHAGVHAMMLVGD